MPNSTSRECGSCQACCHAKVIPAASSPAFSDCPHQCAAGCGIYPERPDGCRRYTCAWVDGWGEASDRPDRLGILFEMAPGPFGGLEVRGIEVRPDGVGEEARARLSEWEALGAKVSLQTYAGTTHRFSTQE